MVRRLAVLVGALVFVGLQLPVLLGHGSNGSVTAAAETAGQSPPTAGDGFEPVLGMPATNMVVLGSSPREASGEAWAYGAIGDVPAIVDGSSYADQLVLLKHTDSLGWQVVPLPSAHGGGPLGSGTDGGVVPDALGSLGGRVTPSGGLVLLTTGGIVIRDPGGAPRLVPKPGSAEGPETTVPKPESAEGSETAAPESGSTEGSETGSSELLREGESLPPASAPAGAGTPYAALDEAGGHTGLLIAPYEDGGKAGGEVPSASEPGILHYDGESWAREKIAWTSTEGEDLAPQALACGGTTAEENSNAPGNCWLLASYRTGTSSESNHLALFRRVASTEESAGYTWQREPVADWLLGGQSPPSGVTGSTSVMPLSSGAQMLTVTSQSVWVDFQAKINGSSTAVDFSELVQAPSSEGTSASPIGTWCYPTIAEVCERTLGASLPARYESLAWPGTSASDPGTRIVTGLQDGAMLELAGSGFEYTIGAGGNGGGTFGAAFDFSGPDKVEQGWIGEGGTQAFDDQGQSQMVDVTPQPQDDQLQGMPVPFRHPLLALAQAPGSEPGDPNAGALAVGMRGEIGRFMPGQGWRSESLYSSSGEAQTPTLRGVAWPEPGRAYAVGDKGAMWLWRADTGLWEPDPATPYNFIGNLSSIAFSPTNAELGYAVGKQGVLLKYGKTWEQVPLPAELQQVNFTSVTFAGGEALATYRVVVEDAKRKGERAESGGLAVEDGSGWDVDSSASALLAQLPDVRDSVLSKVAGLPGGGAVAAGPGLVIERDSSGAPWHFSSQPLPEAQNVSALAAYTEASGAVRAVASIDLDSHMNPNDVLGPGEGAFSGDLAPPTGPGQPPAYLSPDPLPNTGYVLKETANGWSDMEHMALEATDESDMPVRPDPVLALLVDQSGEAGVAVGGQTDDSTGTPPNPNLFETAAAMSFGASGQSFGGDASTPVVVPKGDAVFAVGGAAACEQACANFAEEGLAPDALLSHALQSANQIATSSAGGLRGFLYTGDRLLASSSSLGPEAFQRELARYAKLLGSGGQLPVHAVASPNDLAPGGGIAPFLKTLEPFVPGETNAYYSFPSEGASGGKVIVIALDFSTGTLEAPGASEPNAQEEWLRRELQSAREHRTPAIVMGNASLGFTLPESVGFDPSPVQAKDAAIVSKILVEGGASAYLFDYPGVNVAAQVSFGTTHIPAFGTGTLGYASPPGVFQTDSLGSSGFLLLDVDTAARNQSTNIAPVSAGVEPNIGDLALDASDGVLLRRSQVGLFEALARVPPSGREIVDESSGEVTVLGPAPYEPIPFYCQGSNCADAVPTEYTFSSSNPDIGNFVAHEASSANPRQVGLGPNSLPVADPHSGLFCAYNEGTTIVSITAGGLTYSEPVTVQGGSAEYPCGTVPLKNPPPRTEPVTSGISIPSLTPQSPAPTSPQIQNLVPPPPVPVPPHVHHLVHHTPLPTVPLAPALLFPVLPLLPPPAPNVARPTPPSGTASVSQQVGISEEEKEQQGATEASHHMVAYRHPEEDPIPGWPLGLILVAAAAGVGIRRGRGSPEPAFVRQSRGRRDRGNAGSG